eukprot:m.147707 g.147707  ORF g.147707 m.147707 type:complete len:657 (+) comp24360_c0_seq1:403-2373(+)
MKKSIWSTMRGNSIKFNASYKTVNNVYLIYSVAGSRAFQGYARMTSTVRQEVTKWASDRGTVKFDSVFSVEWLNTTGLPFSQTQDLRNNFNQNKLVKVGRDGQEIEPRTGAKLLDRMNKAKPPPRHTSRDDPVDDVTLQSVAVSVKRERSPESKTRYTTTPKSQTSKRRWQGQEGSRKPNIQDRLSRREKSSRDSRRTTDSSSSRRADTRKREQDDDDEAPPPHRSPRPDNDDGDDDHERKKPREQDQDHNNSAPSSPRSEHQNNDNDSDNNSEYHSDRDDNNDNDNASDKDDDHDSDVAEERDDESASPVRSPRQSVEGSPRSDVDEENDDDASETERGNGRDDEAQSDGSRSGSESEAEVDDHDGDHRRRKKPASSPPAQRNSEPRKQRNRRQQRGHGRGSGRDRQRQRQQRPSYSGVGNPMNRDRAYFDGESRDAPRDSLRDRAPVSRAEYERMKRDRARRDRNRPPERRYGQRERTPPASAPPPPASRGGSPFHERRGSMSARGRERGRDRNERDRYGDRRGDVRQREREQLRERDMRDRSYREPAVKRGRSPPPEPIRQGRRREDHYRGDLDYVDMSYEEYLARTRARPGVAYARPRYYDYPPPSVPAHALGPRRLPPPPPPPHDMYEQRRAVPISYAGGVGPPMYPRSGR